MAKAAPKKKVVAKKPVRAKKPARAKRGAAAMKAPRAAARAAAPKAAAPKAVTHTVVFRICGATVVADPGVVQVHEGDLVAFRNRVGGDVKVYLATGGVLKGVRAMAALPVPADSSQGYLVVGRPGVYECAARYEFKDSKGTVHSGFAIGASSPKIIIQPVLPSG